MSGSEKTVRGYVVRSPMEFIERHYDEASRQAIRARIPSETRALLSDIKDIEWYPWSHEVNIYRALADFHRGDGEQAVRSAFFGMAHEIATTAMGSFLRLLMKLMTPKLFSQKVPTIWERDHRTGKLEVDASDIAAKHLVFKVSDIEGYDYIGAGLNGFMCAPLEACGCKILRHEDDWKLDTPGPESVTGHVWWA